MMTFSIPDITDPAKRAQLPPSPQKAHAVQLLLGCAAIQDPLAVKQLLTAVYLTNYTANPLAAVREMTSNIPRATIASLRRNLEELRIDGKLDDPEALTLSGLFLEAEGQSARAREKYEAALKVPWVYGYSVRARHPAQLPIQPPWIALGYLLKGSRDPEVKALAKGVFERGAKKGDDPLACWEYASYLSTEKEGEKGEWLKFVSKAAASGHREGMLALARFYRKLAPSPSSSSSPAQSQVEGEKPGRGRELAAPLHWLLNWKQGSETKLAREWYQAAGKAGHKEAWMELAEWHMEEGEGDVARSVLEAIVEPPREGSEEEFPQVVKRARGMLGRG